LTAYRTEVSVDMYQYKSVSTECEK